MAQGIRVPPTDDSRRARMNFVASVVGLSLVLRRRRGGVVETPALAGADVAGATGVMPGGTGRRRGRPASCRAGSQPGEGEAEVTGGGEA